MELSKVILMLVIFGAVPAFASEQAKVIKAEMTEVFASDLKNKFSFEDELNRQETMVAEITEDLKKVNKLNSKKRSAKSNAVKVKLYKKKTVIY